MGIDGGRVERDWGRNMSFDSVRGEKFKTAANYGFSYGYYTAIGWSIFCICSGVKIYCCNIMYNAWVILLELHALII